MTPRIRMAYRDSVTRGQQVKLLLLGVMVRVSIKVTRDLVIFSTKVLVTKVVVGKVII